MDDARANAREHKTKWIRGYFDPLLAEHARLLHAASEPDHLMVVLIGDPPEPLLPSRARAELVASLAVVDYVVIDNAAPPNGDLADAGFTEMFIEHVLTRHRGDRA
jgi:bifunctional ADP-heptose synthase (sugar kinase/adenylyltransferase)